MTPSQIQQAQKARQALAQGRFAAALKIARAALKTAPNSGFLANLAGLALVQSGDARAATGYFATAIRNDPEMLEAHSNLAQALIQSNAADKALAVLDKALGKWPETPAFLYLRASAFHAMDRPESTRDAADDALRITPENSALFNLRALAHQALADPKNADADFQTALALAPADPETRNNYASFLAFHARPTEAFAQLDIGLAATPTHPGLMLRKASLLQASGDFSGARQLYLALLTSHPDHPLALNGLAYVSSDAQAERVSVQIGKAMRSSKFGRDEKVLLGFAQAHLAALRHTKDAPKLLSSANAAAARAMPYDASEDTEIQRILMAPYVENRFVVNETKEDPAPIFITGLIRSGTTLAAQILASHPRVTSLGELTQARQLAQNQARAYQATGAAPDGAAFARAYRAGLPPLEAAITHFVDKMPDNFRVIGALLAAFPNATVIEMCRDPRDVALSMWRSFFPTRALAYSNDFSAMADHMNLYARTMHSWRSLFPGRIHTVAYAELTQAQEKTTREIAQICKLDWNSAMLHPEDTQSIVLTASDRQVRTAVHTGSVGKWRDHENLLAPLMAKLDPTLWPLPRQG